jgi:phthalate 4,5-dioxygenase oxygenase subunit
MTATGLVSANWVQLLESLWDTFHAQILHNRANRTAFADTARLAKYFRDVDQTATAPQSELPAMSFDSTPWGFRYRANDRLKDLTYAFIMPWFVHHTVGPEYLDDKAVQIHVPIDDQHTLFWQVMYNRHMPLQSDGYARRSFASFPDLDNFAAGYDRSNSWQQDRRLMEAQQSFTGIAEGRGALQILIEDIAMVESQGKADRSREHLGPADLVLNRGRKFLLDALAAFEHGEPALGLGVDVSGVEAVFAPIA